MQDDVLLDWSSLRDFSVLAEQGSISRAAARSNGIDALTRAPRAGWGVAPLPVAVAGADVHLRRVLPALELASPLLLVTAAELLESPRIRTVFRFLSACFERGRELFSNGVPGLAAP